jgi:hypothetical protein
MKFIFAWSVILAVLLVTSQTESRVAGGWKDIELSDVPAAVVAHAVKTAIDGVGGDNNAVRLVDITGAKSQTVAGKNYELTIKTETTSCPPTATSDEVKDPEACPAIYYSTCTLRVFQSLSSNAALSVKTATCESVA